MADWKFKSKEEVPADLADHVKEVNGEYVVSVSPKAVVTQFRDNNIALAKERDTLKAANEAYAALGNDPNALASEVTELRGIAQQVKDGALKGNAAVTAEVEQRLKTAKDTYEAQLKDLGTKLSASEAKAAASDAKYKRSIVDREVTNAVLAEDSGVNPSALPDVLARAYNVFSVTDEGKLVAKDGDAVIYGQDGVSSLKPKEWLGKVLEISPYLGKQSAGGGANGGDNKGAKHGMSDEAFNKLSPTERINRARGVKS